MSKLIIDKWDLTREEVNSCKITKYYILHWSNGYFIDHYDSLNNTINHQDVNYTVKFHECCMQDIITNDIVKLSFRKGIIGIVLIMPSYKDTNIHVANKEAKYNPSGNWRAPLPKHELKSYPKLIVYGAGKKGNSLKDLKCVEKDKLTSYQLANILKDEEPK